MDDISIAGQFAVEPERNGPRLVGVNTVHGLKMDVGLGAVTGIAAFTQHLAHLNALTEVGDDAALPQMAQRNNDAGIGFDKHMIPTEREPTGSSPPPLGHGIPN